MPIIYLRLYEVKMTENFLNSSLNNSFKRSFGLNVIPERTIQQVKDSALNMLKDVVKPITDIGAGKEAVLDGSLDKQIGVYQRIINAVNMNMNALDTNKFKSLDIKS